jgi:hypothetical protein
MHCTHYALSVVWVLQRRWQSILTNRKYAHLIVQVQYSIHSIRMHCTHYAHLIVQCKRVQHWYRKRIIAKRVKKFKAEDLLYD